MLCPPKVHLLVIMVGCLLVNGFSQATNASGENRKASVAIFPCKADSGVTITEVSFITERVTLEILRQNQFSVIDKYEIAKRTGINSTETYDTITRFNTYFDIGKKCVADQIVWGTLSRKGAMLQLDLRLGDVPKQQVHSTVSTSIVGSTLELSEKIPQLLGTLFNLTVTTTQPSSAGGMPHIVYQPIQQPNPTRLIVRTLPDSARIFLNEVERGITPFVKDSIDPGTYNCRVEKYGYLPFSGAIKIRQNDEKKILVFLERAFGSLTVNSTPEAATVTMSRGVTGITPFTCDTLRPGRDTLRLLLDGYAPIKKKIKIIRNKSDTVRVQLFTFKYLDSVKKENRRRNQIIRRIGFGTLTAGCLGFGLFYNFKAHDAFKRETNAYNEYRQLNSNSPPEMFDAAYNKVQTARNEGISNCKTRNVFYSLTAVFGAGLCISVRF
jgi:hypothetical protein